MILSKWFSINTYMGSEPLPLIGKHQLSQDDTYQNFWNSIVAIYGTQNINGSIPVFLKQGGVVGSQSTLTALWPGESYCFILAQNAILPIDIPKVGALLRTIPVLNCPSLDAAPSTISLNSLIGNYYFYYQSVSSLDFGTEYRYYLTPLASNWPVKIQPDTGILQSSQPTNHISSLISFEQDFYYTNYNTFLPLDDSLDTVNKSKLFALIEVRIRADSSSNCKNIRDTILVLCDRCVPQASLAPPFPSATPTVTPTITVTATVTPSPTPSITTTPTPTPTPTNTPTSSITPTNTVTPTITPTITNTPSITPTVTPSVTPPPSITFNTTSWSSIVNEPYRSYLNSAAVRWANYIKYNNNIVNEIKDIFGSSWNGMSLNTYNLINDSESFTIASCGPYNYVDVLSNNTTNLKFSSVNFNLTINDVYRNVFSEADWVNILTHELGHALGIGIYWDSFFQPFGAQPPSNYFLNGNAYTNTQAGYNSVVGLSRSKTPLEDTGGSGTASGHWENSYRAATYSGSEGVNYYGTTNELMVGTIAPGSSRILSLLTIKALVDFGYEEVNVGASEGVVNVINQPITMQGLSYGLGCGCKSYIPEMIKHTIHVS